MSKSLQHTENLIEETLRQNIRHLNSCFVFPTQLAADLWADRIIKVSDVKAVASKRFLAWDDFKGSSIRSQHQDKISIPSQMRTIFTSQLISENARSPFLKDLIIPEYAQNAAGFVKWISKLLPGLQLWKRKFEESGKEADAEDEDFLLIHKKYSEFLDEYGLFDPAWETPPFKSDGKKYFIFFPEILSDYSEYKEILDSSEDITVINFPAGKTELPEVNFFSNSRIELKDVVLKLRQLHDKENINWQDMAVSVPDMESYAEYIDRALELFRIPHVMRYSKPLSSTGAGNFFTLAQKCVQNDFDYDSVLSLLMNASLPWKNPELNSQLIGFGKENNCLVNYEYDGKKVDVWKESLSRALLSELLASFYSELKHDLSRLVRAESFSQIRTFYFNFRSKFFDMSLCPPESDRILSRCISELGNLIDLEEEFPKCMVSSPLDFFISYLEDKDYLEQTKELGVQILPYKTAAAAPFACHIVVDSSQTSLSVVYKDLSFLRDDKRRFFLQKDDPNVSSFFVQLYSMNSYGSKAYFTCAQRTFSGYSQASSDLSEIDRTADPQIDSSSDIYGTEKNWYKKDFDAEKFPGMISDLEKKGFDFWSSAQKKSEESDDDDSKNIKLELYEETKKRLFDAHDRDILKISYTELNEYLHCPKKFFIERISKLETQKNQAELIDPYAIGNLYHKILELYCDALKKKNLPIDIKETGLEAEYEKILLEKIDEAINSSQNSILAKQLIISAKASVTKTLLATIEEFSRIFAGCKVAGTETSCAYEIPDAKILCNGKFDCLLVDDDEYILIDFKSSNAGIPKNLYQTEESTELPDFQIPMYLSLLENQDNHKKVENACFFNVSDASIKYVLGERLSERIKNVHPRAKIQVQTLTEFEPTMDIFRKSLDEFSGRIRNSDFSEKTSYETCAKCKYNPICRKTFNVSRDS